jgi:adenylate cyclase
MSDGTGDGSPRRLTTERLALEAGTTPEILRRLIEVGAIHHDHDGLHSLEDIPRVRLTLALAEGGIELDALMTIIQSGVFTLDWVARLWSAGEPTGRTYAEFAASLGELAEQLPAIYAALGLALPPPDAVMRQDEETAVAGFVDLWSMVDGRPEAYVRAARVAADGVRRIVTGTLDLFDELGGPPRVRLLRGLSPEDAVRPSVRLSPVVADLVAWLQQRHQESEVFGRVVAYVEDSLTATGAVPRRGEQPAIAFVDLSGYTQLTAEVGDVIAAQFATTLQALAETAAHAHRGRVVKLLGDGVMLRYPSSTDAVASVLDLMKAISGAGLPPAHAGIAAGPMVARDGDVYGHVVNLAARIAAHAGTNELLVAGDLMERLIAGGIACEDAGLATLKGLAQPVPVARVRVS